MSWLTWRQHRLQGLVGLLALAALAALLVPTGLQMHDALSANGLGDCVQTLGPGDARCEPLVDAFSERFTALRGVVILLLVVPVLIGMFLGPALVARELEHGTHRLVWTQGVTRLRWALVKIGLVGAAAVALAVGYALLMSWFITPLNLVNSSRLEPLLYDMQGVVPAGYTLFALALGIVAGTFARKVLPAMALTLFAFVGIRLAVTLFARPSFLPPLRRTEPVVGGHDPSSETRDWIISTGVYDAAGKPLPGGPSFCRAGADPCVDKFGSGFARGAYNVFVYHPADRFWTFQLIETGLFVALAGLLLALAVYRIRRRLA